MEKNSIEFVSSILITEENIELLNSTERFTDINHINQYIDLVLEYPEDNSEQDWEDLKFYLDTYYDELDMDDIIQRLIRMNTGF